MLLPGPSSSRQTFSAVFTIESANGPCRGPCVEDASGSGGELGGDGTGTDSMGGVKVPAVQTVDTTGGAATSTGGRLGDTETMAGSCTGPPWPPSPLPESQEESPSDLLPPKHWEARCRAAEHGEGTGEQKGVPPQSVPEVEAADPGSDPGSEAGAAGAAVPAAEAAAEAVDADGPPRGDAADEELSAKATAVGVQVPLGVEKILFL